MDAWAASLLRDCSTSQDHGHDHDHDHGHDEDQDQDRAQNQDRDQGCVSDGDQHDADVWAANLLAEVFRVIFRFRSGAVLAGPSVVGVGVAAGMGVAGPWVVGGGGWSPVSGLLLR